MSLGSFEVPAHESKTTGPRLHLSNLPSYEQFNEAMRDVAKAHRKVMKPGSFVCFVVAPIREAKRITDEQLALHADTITNFRMAGFKLWQDITLLMPSGSAALRAGRAWAGKKLVPRAQRLLVFKTPESG